MSEDRIEWPFADPENVAVFTTRSVMTDGAPIVYVGHDADDGAWQFHGEGTPSVREAMIVSLREIVEHDPSILELADLPLGWIATRTARDLPWRRRAESGSAEAADGTLDSFASIAALPPETQRALLESGDAVERVHAAWAIGMRLGAAAAPALLSALAGRPGEGARMHFAVLLAGFGEREAVRVLAASDPSPEVRGAAIQALARTAPPNGVDAALADFLSERLLFDVSLVRERILVELRDDVRRALREDALLVAAADPDPAVRRLALDAVRARFGARGSLERLASRLSDETDSSLFGVLASLAEAAADAPILLLAAERSTARRAREILDRLLRLGLSIPFADFDQLVRRDDFALDERIHALLSDPHEEPAAAWLASRLARALGAVSEARGWREPITSFFGAAIHRFEDELDRMRLGAADRRDLEVLLRHFEDLELPTEDDEFAPPTEEWFETNRRRQDALRRAIESARAREIGDPT